MEGLYGKGWENICADWHCFSSSLQLLVEGKLPFEQPLLKKPWSVGEMQFSEQAERCGFISLHWHVLSSPSLISSPTMCRGLACTTQTPKSLIKYHRSFRRNSYCPVMFPSIKVILQLHSFHLRFSTSLWNGIPRLREQLVTLWEKKKCLDNLEAGKNNNPQWPSDLELPLREAARKLVCHRGADKTSPV